MNLGTLSNEDFADHLKKIKETYLADSGVHPPNILLLGEPGSGKTSALATARGPVLIDSFDPGGTNVEHLRDRIDKGEVLVRRFEKENATKPEMFAAWDSTIQKDLSSGLIDSLGTYVVDSATMWFECMLNYIVYKAGRKPIDAGSGNHVLPNPVKKDYGHVLSTAMYLLRAMIASDTCFIMTGHLHRYEDENTGAVTIEPLLSGQLRTKIPMLFDEVWILRTARKGNEVERFITSSKDGMYTGKTRIGTNKFELREVVDISKLLNKAGY